MPNYNPYQYMGASGYGSSPAGYGQNWSYGQQRSNNPYQQMQQGSQNYQQSQDNNFYYPGGQSAPTGQLNYNPYQQQPQGRFPGSSNQFLSPTQGGKGRGFGGFGSNVPSGMGRPNDIRQQGQWNRSMESAEKQFQFHNMLMQQRQMEQQLGAEPGWSWFEPYNRPQMASMPYAQPGAGSERTPGQYGPYGSRY